MRQVLWISVLGVGGVLARYACDTYFTTFFTSQKSFPLSTFAVNVLGSFLIGIVYVLSVEKATLDKELGAALMVGFLGGLTTFSSFSLQSLMFLQNGQHAWAAFYVLASPILGIFAAYMGMLLSRFWL